MSAGVAGVGVSVQERVNCHSCDHAPRFGVEAASRARTRQKYDALSSVTGFAYDVPFTMTSTSTLLAQSAFGLTWS